MDIEGQDDITQRELPECNSTIARSLEELESPPHCKAVMYWAAFTLSSMSLGLLSTWVLSSQGHVPGAWALLNIGLGVVFAVEFFTRSEFRWDRVGFLWYPLLRFGRHITSASAYRRVK